MGLPYLFGEKVLFGVFILLIVIGLGSPFYVGEQQEEHELTESAGTTFEAIDSDFAMSVHDGISCGSCHLPSNENFQHGGDMDCKSCHSTENDTAYDIAREDKPLQCKNCHSTSFNDYNQSIHSIYGDGGAIDDDKPICLDCHAVAPHLVRDAEDTGSPANHEHIIEVCSDCHESDAESLEKGFHEEFYSDYKREEIPSCPDCHGDHNIQPASHPNSTVHSDNVDELCSEECHDFKTNPETVKSYVHPEGFEFLPLLGLIVLIGSIVFCFGHLLVVFVIKKK